MFLVSKWLKFRSISTTHKYNIISYICTYIYTTTSRNSNHIDLINFIIMSFALFINSMLHRLFSIPRLPLLFYAASWTTVLTVTVALASFTPELAFVSAITPASSFSAPCGAGGSSSVRIPLDVPSEVFCFPAELFRKSKMDLVVPPIFAAVVVAASAYVVKALSLWESADQGERH
ncbi:uncharacterized protein LOC116007384 [Ipomoea triloba]|uniref:uncharacterized protein LOC116007384 n=1 Tax=Ipomoea triloba TaxID=35885 RepID=UPI00125D0D8F|nr:uncharacterized protein LOC116007384 [Ipomoea triloba]